MISILFNYNNFVIKKTISRASPAYVLQANVLSNFRVISFVNRNKNVINYAYTEI